MIEKNAAVPIEVLTLEGIAAILNKNRRFLAENDVSFYSADRKIMISFSKGTILRYADSGAPLKDIPGLVSTSREKTGSFIRQVLRQEKAPAPILREQLKLAFTQPPEVKIPDEARNGTVSPKAATPSERPVDVVRSAAKMRREIERLDSRISANVKSLLILLEKRMYRSYRIEGLISALRKEIARYGYIKSHAFGWFSGRVSRVLANWRMSKKRKEIINARLARITDNIAKRDDLLRSIDTSFYARPSARRDTIFMLAGIESELRAVTEEMYGQSTLRQRYEGLANDLRAIQEWVNGQAARPIKDLGSCEAALRATAQYIPEVRRKRVLNIADKMLALKLPVAGDTISDGDITNTFILAHIDEDRAIELHDKDETIVRVRRDRFNPRDPPLEDMLRSTGVFSKIRSAKDAALLRDIIVSKPNLSNLTLLEQEELIVRAESTSLSLILGHSLIGEDAEEHILWHVRTGLNKHYPDSEPTIWVGANLLARITVEELARLLLEAAQYLVVKKNPRETVKHDPAFVSRLYELAASTSVDKTARYLRSETRVLSQSAEHMLTELQDEREKILQIHNQWPPAVVVFGSARIPEDHSVYEIARQFGRTVYGEGWPIRTGAGPSMMEAPLKGYIEAREESGAVVTAANITQGVRIDLTFEQSVNKWVEDNHVFNYFCMRKVALYDNSIGIVIFPGGFGTMDELFETMCRNKPIVFMGKDYWQPILDVLFDQWKEAGLLDYVGEKPLITNDKDEAIAYLRRHAGEGNGFLTGQAVAKLNLETRNGIMELSGWQPGIAVLGGPVQDSTTLSKLKNISSQLASRGVRIHVGMRVDPLERAIKAGIGPNEEDTLKSIVHSEKESPQIQNEDNSNNSFIAKDLSNHRIMLAENSTGFIFLPGEKRTMSMLLGIMTVMQTDKGPRRPIVLLGSNFWKPIKDTIIRSARSYTDAGLIGQKDADYIQIADTPEEVMDILGLRNIRVENQTQIDDNTKILLSEDPFTADGDKTELAQARIAVVTPEISDKRTHSFVREFRKIERLDSRILANAKSLLIMLENRMYRSHKVAGYISVLRDSIAKHGYVRPLVFVWFSKDVLNVLAGWGMSAKKKEIIRNRIAKISENIKKRDALLREIDASHYAAAGELTGPDARRNIVFMLAGIESELRAVIGEMDDKSTSKRRYGEIVKDLIAIQAWVNKEDQKPKKNLGSCEAALRAIAKHIPEARREKVLNIADKIAALRLPVNRVWRGNPPAGSIAGVFEYLCLQNITTSEISLSADDIARGLDRSYETIKYDLRALYYHLFLIKKTDTQGSGRNARYYVPESVKKKASDISPILEQFVGKKLRPAKLDLMYAHKVIANLMGIRDSSAGELNSVKISRRTDDKGRFSIAVPGQKSKRFNIGVRYALSDIEIAPLSTGWENGFEVYHQGDLVGICDSSTGEFEPIQITRRTDDKGRFSVTIPGYKSKRFNIGIDYASSGIELVPSYDDWAKGFIVFHKDNPVAIYDAKKDIFSLTFAVRRPDYKGRFILDGVRYNLGVNYARGSSIREVGIIPFYNFDWSGGFRVYHLDKEIASYDRRRNELVGISLAAKIPDAPDTPEVELAQTRVLLRAQISNKDIDQNEHAFAAKVGNFIIKNRAILRAKAGDVNDVLIELGFNIMEHGNGGELTVTIESFANGRSWLKIIGKDEGNGLPGLPDELVRASIGSRILLAALNDAGELNVYPRGQGFARIALDPDGVIIEYQGKRFVRFTNNINADAWFREEGVSDSSAKGTNFELTFDLRREQSSLNSETETLDKIHDLFQAGVLAQTGDTTKILLSENLFISDGDETELTQVKIALAPVLKSGYIAIMKPDEMRRVAMNQNVSKDKLAIVLTKEEFSDKAIWNGSDKETSLKSSVLILDQRLTGNNYLYLEGVIGLARAVMANNRDAIRAYYELISGSAIDDEVMTLLDDAAQNNLSFAIRAILRFRLITRIDAGDLNERRIRMENFLIAA
ncbi:MAG: LOG family protein [Candidatus Omnitrophica bacterium]|nr:LOG family protein [Candidatus Omnitrophota bacterium]